MKLDKQRIADIANDVFAGVVVVWICASAWWLYLLIKYAVTR